jgi:hypothetical protein
LFLGADGVDVERLAYTIDRVGTAPIVVLAVTSALLRLVDWAGGARFSLPTGSLVIDTGGCKGTTATCRGRTSWHAIGASSASNLSRS